MKKNKMVISILLAVMVIIIIVFLYLNKNNEITFSLNGENIITIDYGKDYIEQGFIAYDAKGNDLSEYVSVSGIVNNHLSGAYEITYELKYKDETKILKRIVMVNDLNLDDIELVLNGEEETYLMVNSTYEEQGAYVLNKIENTRVENDITIYGNVNSSSVGEYEVRYTYLYNGNVVERTRKVIVFDILYHLNPETITSGKVEINFDLTNIKVFKEAKLPDGRTTSEKNIKYAVTENGDYLFTIYTTDNHEYEKSISITNIIGDYSCSGIVSNKGTNINVSGTKLEEIKAFEWLIDGKKEAGSKSISKEKIVNSASVDLAFANGEKKKITCSIKDNLVYHFKYDENNTKPFMKCNTYTEGDRIRLEAQLKTAIAVAGYGTRAGVVEAARFLVGALDYKVPYLGPKTIDTRLGRYSKVGLNIGKKDGWGCQVSGWTQGMDCTNFVWWAFSQNGLSISPYGTSNTGKTVDELSKIRVGDLLLSPCSSGECRSDFSHVGIIIGIDNNYIYVAESTTGKINAIITSKWPRNNMNKTGKFSVVKHVTYASDGNLTNMWLS